MKYTRFCFLLSILILFLINSGCIHKPVIHDPDYQMFKEQVGSTSLLDSLDEGKLIKGMPYYIVTQLFKNYPDNYKRTKILVAGLGSKQQLEEKEGLGRIYTDPNIQIFMDEYDTDKGKLYVWYQFPDFYRLDISAGDTLYIFLSDTVFKSVITCLKNSRALSVENSSSIIPQNKNLYAEIHYKDHPWPKISYWYTIRVLSDGRTFLLKDLQYEIYPVELLELNNEPVNSYQWR